jgi:RNase adaptor protein for sRNA GlmZ degradation
MTTIKQFGFKFVQPPEGAVVLDCRVIKNPFSRGIADQVLLERVRNSPGYAEVINQGLQLIAKNKEVWVGCLYGRHRSAAVAQELAAATGAIIQRVRD